METHKLYNGKIELLFDPEKHLYSVNGSPAVSVTGITGVIAKPALMYWAVNQTVEFIGKVLEAGRAYDEIELKRILADAKFAHRTKSSTAADIGTLVHESIENFIKTGIRKEPVNEKAKAAFLQFLGWTDENKPEFLESERKIYSQNLNYAGTMDFYCRIGEKHYVGDVKTSTGIYDEYWLQTSGYQQAYQEETDKPVDGQIIVRCGKDGSLEVKENYDYEKNVIAFNGAMALFRRIQELKDQAKKNV